MDLIHIVLHLDQYLGIWFQDYGLWLYFMLFLVIFGETGLIVTPFLPGDSLLFALGAMTTIEGGLSLGVLSFLLVAAAFIGDNLNYRVGRWLGPQVFSQKKSKLLNPSHLASAQNFYLRHGAQAIILARFLPIVRTFVPFVAGVGSMPFRSYLLYSLFGAILWTQIFLWAGHLFGAIPSVKTNFHIVIFAVIGVSLLPLVYAAVKSRLKQRNSVST